MQLDGERKPCNAPGCSAPVLIVRSEENRLIKVDPKPHADGVVVAVRGPSGDVRARVLGGVDLPAQVTAWRRHETTCTDPDEVRRRLTRTAPRCAACDGPMDADLARRERWRTHPSCDPEHYRPRQRPARRPTRRPA